jgi:hypothetical protein
MRPGSDTSTSGVWNRNPVKSSLVLMPLSLGPVRQTFPAIRLYQNLSLCHLSLGGRSGPENAEDGALCDSLFTVMEWSCRRGVSRPFLAI